MGEAQIHHVMITALKTVGQTHTIQIVASYEGDTASVTVMLTPKTGAKEAKPTPPLHVSGPVAEVEEYLAKNLGTAAEQTVTLTTSIAELEKKRDEAFAAAAKAEASAKKAEEKKTEAKKAKEKPQPVAPAKTEGKLSEVKPSFVKKAEPAKAEPPKDDDGTAELLAELESFNLEGGQP